MHLGEAGTGMKMYILKMVISKWRKVIEAWFKLLPISEYMRQFSWYIYVLWMLEMLDEVSYMCKVYDPYERILLKTPL